MSEASDITAPRLWTVLFRAHSAIAHYAEQSIAGLGLCLSDFAVLELLLHKGPQSISMIGERVLLASASMTSAVDRLEERGLVVRRGCPSDRRIRIVELTEEGRRFISELFAQHERDLAFLTEDLTPEEKRILHEGLKKMGLKAKHATRPQAHGHTGPSGADEG